MMERIRSLIDILQQDPTDDEAFTGLEELVTGDDADSHLDELLQGFEDGRARLLQAGRFGITCKIIDLEFALIEDQAREIDLLKEQARLYDEELFDQKTALDKLKKIVALDPDEEALANKIKVIEAERENWQQIVETFETQAQDATESSLKAHMLYSAAERTYKNHKRGKDIPRLLQEALETDHTHIKAARLLERVFKDRERWTDLAQLYAKLAEYRRSREERTQMLLAAAHTQVYRLEDKAQAAIHYGDVLDLSPGNQTALRFLVKYYEELQDWDHLVAVYEDALAGRHSPEDEVAMLMQAG